MVRRRRGRSPKKTPPEPPEPCPSCGECPPPTATTVTHRSDDGAVVGDVLCDECGHQLATGVLFRDPDYV